MKKIIFLFSIVLIIVALFGSFAHAQAINFRCQEASEINTVGCPVLDSSVPPEVQINVMWYCSGEASASIYNGQPQGSSAIYTGATRNFSLPTSFGYQQDVSIYGELPDPESETGKSLQYCQYSTCNFQFAEGVGLDNPDSCKSGCDSEDPNMTSKRTSDPLTPWDFSVECVCKEGYKIPEGGGLCELDEKLASEICNPFTPINLAYDIDHLIPDYIRLGDNVDMIPFEDWRLMFENTPLGGWMIRSIDALAPPSVPPSFTFTFPLGGSDFEFTIPPSLIELLNNFMRIAVALAGVTMVLNAVNPPKK